MTERIYWLCKGKPNVYKNQTEYKKDIWIIQPSKEKEHPAPFPYEIPLNAILLTTQPGELVLDPFSGTGTTGMAAQCLDRGYIGIELSKHYCDLAERRGIQ